MWICSRFQMGARFCRWRANIPAMMKENQISVVIETLSAKGAKFFFAGQKETGKGHKGKGCGCDRAGDAFWAVFLQAF